MLTEARVNRVISNVLDYSSQFSIVSDYMIVAFVLPERTPSAKQSVRLQSCVPLKVFQNLRDNVGRRVSSPYRGEYLMYMIRHDAKRQQIINTFIAMQYCFLHNPRNFVIGKPLIPFLGTVQKTIEMAKVSPVLFLLIQFFRSGSFSWSIMRSRNCLCSMSCAMTSAGNEPVKRNVTKNVACTGW